MTYTFITDKTDLFKKLERLQFEVDARKEVLSYLITTNSAKVEAFSTYEDEYIAYFKEYQITKSKFEHTVILPYCEQKNISFSSWSLEFDTGEVKILA